MVRLYILSVICLYYVYCCFIEAKSDNWDIFIQALIMVESRGDPSAIGNDKDVGILQITPIYVDEVNRISKDTSYSLECRFDPHKSLEMFEIYQNYYNPDKDIAKAIKLHNPGADTSYYNKIMCEFHRLRKEKNNTMTKLLILNNINFILK